MADATVTGVLEIGMPPMFDRGVHVEEICKSLKRMGCDETEPHLVSESSCSDRKKARAEVWTR